MSRIRFLSLFLILSTIGKIFALEFALGNKKINISIPDQFFSCGSKVVDQGNKSFDYCSVEEGEEQMLKIQCLSFDNKSKVGAELFIDSFIKKFEVSGLSIKIQKKENKSFNNYVYSSALITLPLDNNKRCICLLSAYSSNNNLIVVMNMIDLQFTTKTEAQIIKELKKFESKNIKVI